jgi:mRNA interferase MazF
VIRQGEIYWIDLGEPDSAEPGWRRPFVVVQNDVFNASRLHTVVVCALTSNPRLAAMPGNVLLDEGEAGLPRRSVVNVTQLFTVDRSHLDEKIGTLSPARVRQIVNGIRQLLEPAELE